MLTIIATANDIELALNELHQLASQGTGSDARRTGELLLSLCDGDNYPLNLQDLKYLAPRLMRQVLQLVGFLMTTGTPIQKFVSEEAMDKVKDNLSAIRCEGFVPTPVRSITRPEPPTPPPARLSSQP